jgi:putative hydrolase of the HAD superfamily
MGGRGAPPIELVVFDLGGVLVRIAPNWAESHALAGLPPHPIVKDAAFRARAPEIAEAHQRGAVTPEQWAAEVARLSGGAYTAEQAFTVLDAWIVGEYPGVDAVFDALDAAGVATAVLSNTNPRHWAHPLQAATRARARHAHASHLLGALKPEPAIYERFEAATGAPASAILFFDDGPANVEAARARGWRAEHIDSAGDTAAQLLDALRRHVVIRQRSAAP